MYCFQGDVQLPKVIFRIGLKVTYPVHRQQFPISDHLIPFLSWMSIMYVSVTYM